MKLIECCIKDIEKWIGQDLLTFHFQHKRNEFRLVCDYWAPLLDNKTRPFVTNADWSFVARFIDKPIPFQVTKNIDHLQLIHNGAMCYMNKKYEAPPKIGDNMSVWIHMAYWHPDLWECYDQDQQAMVYTWLLIAKRLGFDQHITLLILGNLF